MADNEILVYFDMLSYRIRVRFLESAFGIVAKDAVGVTIGITIGVTIGTIILLLETCY
ncbi:hypothetical protein C2G38_2180666 [Gigaspora rosea]|uniref:Uncharacterized protein n=1 Tax=Gigaspora rosea TaxID=44941 RepID=A0A397VEW8_9GLOM|nr:hypothetical protein C2G38_2180666 [Gigaspora rosea]